MWFIILLIVIVLLAFVGREGFSSIFNRLHSYPSVRYNQTLDLPYCSDCLGKPVQCLKPCGRSYVLSNGVNVGAECKTCDFDYPVPVLGSSIGPYSPSVWTPGAPFH